MRVAAKNDVVLSIGHSAANYHEVLTAIDNGMNLNNVNSFLQQVVKGLILIVAVALDQWAHRRGRRV